MPGGSGDIALDATITASLPGPGIDEDLPRGTSLGRYVTLGRLGTGGMGIVYAAYDPQLDRRVALKLLRSSSRSPDEQRARLLREAQAMARISHPNVIAVHDVGTLEHRVFVAMELVEGVTLEVWLAERERGAREIVAAFAQAGRGLAAAHDKGLVHRDFKPDNALFGIDGRVRVLDFGLAYAADDAPFEASGPSAGAPVSPGVNATSRLSSRLTHGGMVLGTPWYMSPEQLAGQLPDARSDQWSFCAALHEALYGEHPFAQPGDGDIATLERRVRSGERREVSAQRSVRVPMHVRAAVQRGLAVDPGARFPTMTALVAELEPESRGARRAWMLFAAATIVLGISLVSTLRARPAVCEGAARELDGAWDETRRGAVAAAFSATGKSFAGDALRATTGALDAYAAAWIAMQKDACEATRVRGVQSEELLDLRTQCLAERRTELRALVDVLAKADADSAERGPLAARSLSSLDPCANATLLRAPSKLPADAGQRDAVASARNHVARARALEQAGQYPAMLDEAKAAVADAEGSSYRPALAEARVALGRAHARAGDDPLSEQTLFDAVLDAEASHDDLAEADAWPPLILARAGLFEFDRTDTGVRQAEAAIARVGGDPAREADLESVRARVERLRGHYDDAAAHGRAALALTEKQFGAGDIRVADALEILAVVLNMQSKCDEAIADVERALGIVRASLGPDHPKMATLYETLSNSYDYLGDSAKALDFARQSLAVREAAFPPEHPLIAATLVNLANAQADSGDLDAAGASYRRALAIREKTVGSDSPKIAGILYDMGQLSVQKGAYAEAVSLLERAIAIQEKAKGPTHTDVGAAVEALGTAFRSLGRPRDALAAHERALGILEAGFGKEHPDVASALVGVGRDELDLHDVPAAIAALERAVAIYAKVEASDEDRADARFALARALWEGGRDRARARSLAEDARGLDARSGKSSAKALTDVEAWLRAHGA